MKYKINGSIKRNYGGGGGGTTSTIPEWAKTLIMENVGKAAEGAYGSGDLNKVAGSIKITTRSLW